MWQKKRYWWLLAWVFVLLLLLLGSLPAHAQESSPPSSEPMYLISESELKALMMISPELRAQWIKWRQEQQQSIQDSKASQKTIEALRADSKAHIEKVTTLEDSLTNTTKSFDKYKSEVQSTISHQKIEIWVLRIIAVLELVGGIISLAK
jgi:hypothetical protein